MNKVLLLVAICCHALSLNKAAAFTDASSRGMMAAEPSLSGVSSPPSSKGVIRPWLPIGRGPHAEELDRGGNAYPEYSEDDADDAEEYDDDDEEESIAGAIDDDVPGLLGAGMPTYPEPIPLGEAEARARGCDMNPPFLYIAFHTGPNIAKFTKDGCYLSREVLYTEPEGREPQGVEFRSMMMAPFEEHAGAMYIANAAKRGSQVLVYSPCGVKSPHTATISKRPIASYQRDLLHVVTAKHPPRRKGREGKFRGTFKRNRGANHCYGLAMDIPPGNNVTTPPHGEQGEHGNGRPAGLVPPGGTGSLFASFQHTNTILWFDAETMSEKGLPLALESTKANRPYYPSTFHQWGFPHGGRMPMGSREEGTRAMVVVTGADGKRKLWAANEGISSVAVFDIATGIAEDYLQVETAITMFHFRRELDGGDDRVYIGSSTTHNTDKPTPPGRVYAVNAQTMQIEEEYSMPGWIHPTGLFVSGRTLYVAEQKMGAIFTIDIETKAGKRILSREDLPMLGVVEGMVGSPC